MGGLGGGTLGRVSAGCAGVGDGVGLSVGTEPALPEEGRPACRPPASSLPISRAWLAHCCAADARAQGRAAATEAAGAGTVVAGPAGAVVTAWAAPVGARASSSGVAGAPGGALPANVPGAPGGLDVHVWSRFRWAS